MHFTARDGAGAGQLSFTSIDISIGGAFLKSDLLLEQHEPLSLEFSLDDEDTKIRAQAKVAWVRRFPLGDEPAGMGVEFVTIRDDDKETLQQFLRG